ncbi:hypothetical protein SAMN04487977_109114 [Treponema bryantii]|uniref:Lipoprotein n=1 Tax=Treponema bryantii TaxID=163 RepID=A0A1H9IG00_9SPIR|nr:hypothetical protein [Treponema bryantii]SEQ73325.1 hypothetical protein SAMN04487977_109114 [Treponema bryantii]
MKKLIKKLISVSLLFAVAITFMGCKNNANSDPTSSADPIVSKAELEALTEVGNIPADITNGNWVLQTIQSNAQFRLRITQEQYEDIISTLSDEEIAAVADWITEINYGDYRISFPTEKFVNSTIYNITKSEDDITVTSGTEVTEFKVADPLKKILLNKCVGFYGGSYNWEGDTTLISANIPAENLIDYKYEIIHMMANAGSLIWNTNADKTVFYAKETYGNNVEEYIIVKK